MISRSRSLSSVIRYVLVLVFITSLCGCSGSKKASPIRSGEEKSLTETMKGDILATRKVRGKGEVAPGFLIRLANPDDEKLNGQFRVDFDGVLVLPYEIKIQTASLDEAELKRRIGKGYRDFFQAEPNIQVEIVERDYFVEVGGLVEKPGRYIVKENASLGELIALAGGLQKSVTTDSIANYVRIDQLGTTLVVRLRDYYSGASEVIPSWQGGDVVFFQSQRGDIESTAGFEKPYVRILGQATTPGEYTYLGGADFDHYLIKAGGPTERADLERITLYRSSGVKTEQIEYEADDDGNLPEILPGDVLLVNSDAPTASERRTRYIAEVTSIFGTLATIVLLLVTL